MRNIYAKYLTENHINENFSEDEIKDLFSDYVSDNKINLNILLNTNIIEDIISDFDIEKEKDLNNIFKNIIEEYSLEIKEESEMPIENFKIGAIKNLIGTAYKKGYEKFIKYDGFVEVGKKGYMGFKEIKRYKENKYGGIVYVIDNFENYGKIILFDQTSYISIKDQLIYKS